MPCSVAEACRATAAAPCYLPAKHIGTDDYYDGSLVCNSNPTSLGIAEAKKLFPHRKIDLIVSVGTGLAIAPGHSSIFQFVYEILDSIANPEQTYSIMKKKYKEKLQRLNIRVENTILDECRLYVLKKIKNQAEHDVTDNYKKYDDIAQILCGQRPPFTVTTWNWIDVGGYAPCAKYALENGLREKLGTVNLTPVTQNPVLHFCERSLPDRPWDMWQDDLKQLKTTLSQSCPGNFIISSQSPVSAAVVIGFWLQKGGRTVIFCDSTNPYLYVNGREFPEFEKNHFEILLMPKRRETPYSGTKLPSVFLFLSFGKNSNAQISQVQELCSQNNLELVCVCNATISVPKFQYKPGLEGEMAEQLEILHATLAKELTELSSTNLLFATDAPWAVAMLFGVVFNSNLYPAWTYHLLEQVHGKYQLAFTIPDNSL